jgi:hypothetical protein
MISQFYAVVGVEHVHYFVANHPNGGLTWLYNMTRKDEAPLAEQYG